MASRPLFRRRDRDDAFGRRMRPHLPGRLQCDFRRTRNESAAEDLVQHTCLRFLPRLDTLERLDNLRQWLAKALYRMFVDQYRRDQRSPVDFQDEVPDGESSLPTPEIEALRACTQLNDIARLINGRPRETLVWKAPEEVLAEEIQDFHHRVALDS